MREVTLRRRRASTPALAWGPPKAFQIERFQATLTLDEPIFDSREAIDLLVSIAFAGEAPRPVAIYVRGDKVQGDGKLGLGGWYPADIRPSTPPPPKVARRLWSAEVERLRVPASILRPAAPPAPEGDGHQGPRSLPDRDVVLTPKALRTETRSAARARPVRAPAGIRDANGTPAARSSPAASAAPRQAVSAAQAPAAAEPAPAPAPEPAPEIEAARSPTAHLQAPPADDARVFQERERAIQRDHLIRRAFLEHDRDTNPGLDPVKWAQEMDELNVRLGGRIQVYAACGKAGVWPQHGALQPALKAKTRKVSQSFRRIFEGLAEADASVDLFDWAFEFFATGAVVTRHNEPDWQDKLLRHGTPNSAYFLRFTMLAIVCIENDLDADFWRKHLRSLVRTAHIFLESAAPLKDDPYPADESEFVFYPDRYFPRSRRKELRAEYAGEVGAGLPSAQEFDALRARFASLLGRTFLSDTGSSVPRKPIPAGLAAVLKPFGVGDA